MKNSANVIKAAQSTWHTIQTTYGSPLHSPVNLASNLASLASAKQYPAMASIRISPRDALGSASRSSFHGKNGDFSQTIEPTTAKRTNSFHRRNSHQRRRRGAIGMTNYSIRLPFIIEILPSSRI